MSVSHLADCQACEPRWPLRFDTSAERTRWIIAHEACIGHQAISATVDVDHDMEHVLAAIIALAPDDRYGGAIARAAGFKPGTITPVLDRLETAGLVRVFNLQTRPGRPDRFFYSPTAGPLPAPDRPRLRRRVRRLADRICHRKN